MNFSHVRFVCMQHEYGIFGGDDGGYILDFVRALRVPTVVTLHTVLKQPVAEPSRDRPEDVRAYGAQLVVMSQVAKDLLDSSYGVRGSKVRIIPHGIPVMDHEPDQER